MILAVNPRLKQFTVEEYEKLVEIGFIRPEDHVELLRGLIVEKMAQNPPHAVTVDLAEDIVGPLLPAGWRLRQQKPITTSDSQPEPDLIIVRGPLSRYFKRHPLPKEIAAALEVSDTTLTEDRDKAAIYAEAGIPVYWIINLGKKKIEVYTNPRGGKSPGYRSRRDYGIGEALPVVVEGKRVGLVAVIDFFPRFS